MFRAFLLAGCITLSTVPFSAAKAGFVTGNELYELCTSTELEEQTECLRYIQGSVDGFIAHRALTYGKYCMPEGITAGQYQDIALKLMREQPEQRHNPASLLVWSSIKIAFPACKD